MGAETAWPIPHCVSLECHVTAGFLSFSMIADALNAEFGTRYTRSSVLGKAWRMGLREVKKLAPNVTKRQKIRKYKDPFMNVARLKVKPASIPQEKPILVFKHLSFEAMVACDGCRWAFGNGPFTFCGNTRLQAPANEREIFYCAEHYDQSVGHGSNGERSALRGIPLDLR